MVCRNNIISLRDGRFYISVVTNVKSHEPKPLIILDSLSFAHGYIVEDRGEYFRHCFYVQLTDDPNSETMIYHIGNDSGFPIHDQNGNLLNPDGWLWALPERVLSQEETLDRLWAGGGAARWYEYCPEKDIVIDDVLFYCYATYTWPEFNDGESHTGFIWVNSVTGEFEAYGNPLFEWLSNPLFEISESHKYEILASLHESLPEYRYVATGLMNGSDEWAYGYVIRLDIYDEDNKLILSADFSETRYGETPGHPVYNQMMDTMGLHVVDVNFD